MSQVTLNINSNRISTVKGTLEVMGSNSKLSFKKFVNSNEFSGNAYKDIAELMRHLLDLKITFRDKKIIYAHSVILSARCALFALSSHGLYFSIGVKNSQQCYPLE